MVDSNVIFDVTNNDPVWADWSDSQIIAYQPGGLLINLLIFTELCTSASTTEDVDRVLTGLKLELRELARETLFLTAKAFLKYRRQGGTETAPLPDFFMAQMPKRWVSPSSPATLAGTTAISPACR